MSWHLHLRRETEQEHTRLHAIPARVTQCAPSMLLLPLLCPSQPCCCCHCCCCCQSDTLYQPTCINCCRTLLRKFSNCQTLAEHSTWLLTAVTAYGRQRTPSSCCTKLTAVLNSTKCTVQHLSCVVLQEGVSVTMYRYASVG